MSLLKRIESDKIQSDSIQISFLGQSGYVIKTIDSIIYIDPYLSDYVEHDDGLNQKNMKRNYKPPIKPEEIKKIDAVLCTHSHVDHMDPWTLEGINQDFIFIATENAYNNNPTKLSEKFIRFIDLSNEPINIKNINIRAIPAAHYHLLGSDGKPDCISFIIQVYGKTFLFWGDGVIYDGLIEKLKEYSFDLLFAPINGRDWFREKLGIVGNLNSRELAELCREIDIGTVIPNHHDLFDYNGEYLEHFTNYLNKFCPNQTYNNLSYGDSLIL
tara:strand:+ start:3127 stop:3939 length:813 start_codon:yes stop_codon:yes gene_type:complete